MSASGKKAFEPLFEPKVPGFPKAQLNDLASVERLITDKTIAVMLEPIQGEAGVWPATDKFLQRLARPDQGARPVADRRRDPDRHAAAPESCSTTSMPDIEPDIMTLGKGIGGGVPLAALLATQRRLLFRAWRPGRHLQRQSADVRGRACGAAASQRAGFSEIGGRDRPLSGKRIAADVARGTVLARSAAAACCWRSTEASDRRIDRRAGIRRWRAAQRAAAGHAAFYAGAQRHREPRSPG